MPFSPVELKGKHQRNLCGRDTIKIMHRLMLGKREKQVCYSNVGPPLKLLSILYLIWTFLNINMMLNRKKIYQEAGKKYIDYEFGILLCVEIGTKERGKTP